MRSVWPRPHSSATSGRSFTSSKKVPLVLLSTTVSVDFQILIDRLSELVCRPDLRRRMGESGQRRAREVFDWRGGYGQYQALWAQQTALRQARVPDGPAPTASPSRPDPFASFATYPTHHITPATRVAPGPGPGVG